MASPMFLEPNIFPKNESERWFALKDFPIDSTWGVLSLIFLTGQINITQDFQT